MLHDLWYRFRALVRPAQAEQDLDDELAFHLERERERLEAGGASPAEARRLARVKFGSMPSATEACRETRGIGLLTSTARDLRYALRSLRAAPLVAGAALVSLTLGIGATTALFSIVDSLLLRPLPVAEPDRLVLLENGSWTNPVWEQIRARQDDLFDGAFAWSTERFDLSTGGETEFVDGAYASGRLFGLLGVRPARGRMLAEADDVRGGGPEGAAAVISYRFWQQHFGGRDDAVGGTLTLNRVPFTVVGVMPPRFFGPDVGRVCDVVVPIGTEPLVRGDDSFLDGRSTWWLNVMARLKPGQTPAQATAALQAAQAGIREATVPPDYPPQAVDRYLGEPLSLTSAVTGASRLRSTYRQPLVIVTVVVGLVLLIACANIASLFLARAAARRREIGVRLALGASRLRVARQLLLESVLIAGAGAAFGLLFARWSSAMLVRQLSTWQSTVYLDLTLDWRVLTFVTMVAVGTALIFGIAPALGAARIHPQEVLRDGGRTVAGHGRTRLRGALVVGQVALSVTLVVAAGLFLRSFARLSTVPLGFTPDRLVVVDLLQTPDAPPADPATRLEQLRDAVGRVPGVTSVAASVITPLSGAGWNTGIGEERVDARERMSWVNAISSGWLRTYGLTLVAGRDFGPADRPGSTRVALVNEAFVARFITDGVPVGHVVASGDDRYEVVGVVSNAVYRSPREGIAPTMYLPLTQQTSGPGARSLTVATSGPVAAVERAISTALRSVAPGQAFTFRTFDELTAATVSRERLVALLSGFFGALALLLAGVGLYGITAYGANLRRTEIGVRMALGARPGGIARMVLRRTGWLLVTGLILGGTASLWLTRYVASLLFELEPTDPGTFVLAAGTLLLVGLVAAWLPARRAARLDPASVLRE